MKKGQKVWKVEINKGEHENTSIYKTGVFITELKILGISDAKICLDDNYFTTFANQKRGERKDSWNSYLDQTNVKIRTTETYFPNGVFISGHFSKKPTKKHLQKMVLKASKEIDSKYGFLFSGVKQQLESLVNEFKVAK